MKTYTFVLMLFLFSIDVLGQASVIEGWVMTFQGDPLPFATISIANGTRGTISNASGDFRLILREEDRNDSLRVSFVGFQSKNIKLSSLGREKLIIKLVEKQERLDEVVVTSLTANKVLENALENIAKNYFQQPYSSKGFYRLVSKKNEKYVHLSEVAFDLYRSKDPDKVDLFRLDTWRGITDEREANGIDLGMRPSGILGLDKVNSKEFLKTFNKKRFLKEHRFLLEGEFTYDGKPAYLISFDQIEGIKDLGLKGHFYIRKGDFAFLEMDYGLSPKSVQYFKFGVAYQALMKLFGIDISLLGNKTWVRYQKIGERYYLKDARLNTDLKFESSRDHFNFVLNSKVDYLVSELDLQAPKRFDDDEVLSHGKLIEFQTAEYDSLFWNDYTIVLPTTDFDEISNVILENNKANDTKKEVRGKLKKFPKEPGARIDSILTFYHKRGLFHGNAIVADQGQPILSKSYPYKEQQLDLSSRFRIGSTSKTFTSMLILMLEKEGKLGLSDPISTYIPHYKHGEVTIAQLLSHQSGIPNYLSKNEYLVDVFKTRYSLDELVQKFCSDTLEFAPGESFAYSNSGYILLAKIAEVVGGKPFAELLAEKIFGPLDMEQTSFGLLSPAQAPVEGFYYGQPEESYPAQNVIGAGGVVSTTEDLLKWSNALEDGTLIDQSIVQKLQTPRAEYKDWDAYYGYGWMIDKYLFRTSKKHTIVYHPGTDIAFFSMFLKQPDEHISIILLSNTGDFPRFEMADLILEVLN